MSPSSHKSALVTGASRGVGAATARFLAERGFDVVVTYRTKARRAEAVAAVNPDLAGGDTVYVGSTEWE